jgi:hypothetical protein
LTTQYGPNHYNWKGGRRKKDDYWLLYMPEYHASNKQGNVYEHIYIYEQYHKLCMLSWGSVHHKDGNGSNNEISNLQGMMQSHHCSLHMKGKSWHLGKHKDTSNIICFKCKRNKTTMEKPNGTNKTPFPRWKRLPWDKINWYCASCYTMIMKKRRMEEEY